MAHHPADVGGGEHDLSRPHVIDVLHGHGQRHRVATHVALHALGLSGGAGGVEDVAGFVGFQPRHRHVNTFAFRSQRVEIHIAPGCQRQGRIELAVDHEHMRRRELRFCQRRIDQRLVGNHLAAAHAGIGANQHGRFGIVDAQGQVVRGKTTEHHRVDRAQTRTGQHRHGGFDRVRHVDHHALALAHAQVAQCLRKDIHLPMQGAIAQLARIAGFSGDAHQGELVAAFGQMPVHRVVAQVGLPANEPAPERRTVVFQCALRRHMPVDAPGLLCPETFRVVDGPAVHFVVGHAPLPA